jgi:hypothetical protein
VENRSVNGSKLILVSFSVFRHGRLLLDQGLFPVGSK